LLTVKMHIFIGFFLINAGTTASFAQSPHHAPSGGVLDLSGAMLGDEILIKLDGEWVFHWEELLTPDNFRISRSHGIPVQVPSYWSSYQIDGSYLPGMGYGTYCLQIILPQDFQSSICFDIPVFDVAYNFYLNNRLMASNGKVGTSREMEEPWYDPSSFCLIPDGDTLQVLVQVSNFHHRRGGFWKSMYMGGSAKVLGRREQERVYNYSSIGVLFFFMFFFLIFWSFTRKDLLTLLFALTTMGILMRAVNTGLYLSNYFAATPWAWQIRMEYLGSYLAFLFGMMFLHKLFPLRYMNRVILINSVLILLGVISLFLLPVHLFTYEMLGFQPLMILFLGHYMVVSFLGILKGKLLDGVFFVSLAFFISTLVNDILLANSAGPVSSIYLSPLSFQIFILAMAVLVILQWIKNSQERLHLESSLRFKNRVLSVIAHDLKNPIASVAQFSDLLANKPELVSRGHVIQSLRESSQAAVTLLDNLLYWGRSQADALKITPARIEMEPLLKDVRSLYQHMAVQKELKFTLDTDQGIAVVADKVLITIVLRNLVSNAIKFTPQKGSVEIRAWQEGACIKCMVADTGIGIKPEYLEVFHKKGHMSSTAGTDQEIGTGLGLELVRDLLEQNNGTLQIESEPGKGSTFTFTLPADN
jgi:signal transduction histidine kinase